MKFSIGIELPDNETQAFGIVIPAIPNCFSAADKEEDIESMVTEAITLHLEYDSKPIESILDKGIEAYSQDEEYSFCDRWITIDIT